VPKSASCSVLWGAIGLARAGGMYLPPQLLRRLEPLPIVPHPEISMFEAYAGAPVPDLTRRQADVLRLMAQGKPNKVISRELGIAAGTVKEHVTALPRALRVNNRTEAVSATLKGTSPASALGHRVPSRLN
jgi:DNA-binding NarL/FixJ family response regulator